MLYDTNDRLVAAILADNVGDMIRELDAWRSVEERFALDYTPLHFAAENGAWQCTGELLARGADLEAQDFAGWTPLILALQNDQAATASRLLDLGARIAFLTADSPATRKMIENLFHGLATPDELKVESILTAHRELHAIHHCGGLATLQLFGGRPGINFNLHDGACYWPLKTFAGKGHVEAVRWLLQQGAEPNFTSTGDTALHAAVAGNHLECARLLLESGADPNQGDVDCCVPMIRVASMAMLELLMEHGADPNIPDQCGHKASHWAENAELKRRLLELEDQGRRIPRR